MRWWIAWPPRRVTLDVCPWSNVRLRVVKSLAAHPIRRLHERGVRLTINTDDPTVFGRTLSEELTSLVEDLGFTHADLARFQANAFAVAALPAATRAALLAELHRADSILIAGAIPPRPDRLGVLGIVAIRVEP